MISIVFAVPYPGMRDTVMETFENHPMRRQLAQSIKVVQAELLDISALKGSIIIARGMTYRKIRTQFPRLPCVEVVVHTSDIIAALLSCHRHHAPRRIALIGGFPHLPPPDMLRSLVGCDVVYHPQQSVRTIADEAARALEEGADAFVGGYSLCHWAKTNGHPATIVASGPEAIRGALDEAIRTYSILQEKEVSRIALENTREAVVYADQNGVVNYLNPAARRLLDTLGLAGEAENVPLHQAMPFLAPLLDTPDSRSLSFDDELFDWRGTKLAASAVPAFVGDIPSGLVITVNTVERIRRQEYSIRERLSEKGLSARYTFKNILYGCPKMEQVVAKAKKCALVDSNLLLIGETGTGKELFAQSVHNHSLRKHGPFIAINCAALPEHLIESELFGYSGGAFTGARRGGKLGLFETAHGGTLFLDEVSELPLPVQGKLLRVLQEHEVRRVGDDKVTTVDVRVISASNTPLPEIVRQGRFRRDLLYRLDILGLHIPPLRERREDIDILFHHHMRQYNKRLGGNITSLSPEAERLLFAHPFDGNVRELRNIVERLCVLCEHEEVSAEEMADSLNHSVHGLMPQPLLPAAQHPGGETFHDTEARRIRDALSRSAGNRGMAAKLLGVDRSTLWRKMRRYGISFTN